MQDKDKETPLIDAFKDLNEYLCYLCEFAININVKYYLSQYFLF